MNAIQTRGLVKDYGVNGVVVHALRGVEVGFEPGEWGGTVLGFHQLLGITARVRF